MRNPRRKIIGIARGAGNETPTNSQYRWEMRVRQVGRGSLTSATKSEQNPTKEI